MMVGVYHATLFQSNTQGGPSRTLWGSFRCRGALGRNRFVPVGMPREQGRWCELQKVRGVRSFWNIGGHAIGLTHRVQTLPCNQQFVLGAGQGYVKNSAFFFDRIRISYGAIRGVGTGRYVGDIAHGTFGSFGGMHRD